MEKIDLVLSDGELEDKPEQKGNNDGGGNDPMMQDTVKMSPEDIEKASVKMSPEDIEKASVKMSPEDIEKASVKMADDIEENLTDSEIKQVDEFSEKIDVRDSKTILSFGSGAQKKMAVFSDKALENVKSKDLGEIGDMLSNLVGEIRDFDSDKEDKGFLGIFKKNVNKLENLRAKYAKAEVNVDRIVKALDTHQVQLFKDIAMLDQMYDMNRTYYKELSMYILAGKKKIRKLEEEDLVLAKNRAKQTGRPEDVQNATDLASLIDRFDKKVHDLELTRMISIQTAPQIRLIQSNDSVMAEKIQSTIVNTIPLWKQQMVLALGVEHQGEAAKAEREVTDMTNALLKKNAETLKISTIETAKESERGIVDIETLKQTNQSLISTLDEVIKIQNDGRQKRKEAEAELTRIEGELKDKLLSMRQ
jgi:uncharacterized protein YaaN involved in tellurite resistance